MSKTPRSKSSVSTADPIASLDESNSKLKTYLSRIDAVKGEQTLGQLYRDLDVQLTRSAAVTRQSKQYAEKLVSTCQECVSLLEAISDGIKRRIEGLQNEETTDRNGKQTSTKTNATPLKRDSTHRSLSEKDTKTIKRTATLHDLLQRCSSSVDEQVKVIVKDVVDTALSAARAVANLQTTAGLQVLKQKVVREMPDIEAIYKKQYETMKAEEEEREKRSKEDQERIRKLEEEKQILIEKQKKHEDEIHRRAHEEAQRRIQEELEKIKLASQAENDKTSKDGADSAKGEQEEKRKQDENRRKKEAEEQKKKNDEEREKRRLEEEKTKKEAEERVKQRKMEDESRRKEEEDKIKRNPDLWPFVVYRKNLETYDQGVACILRTYPTKVVFKQDDLKVSTVSDEEYLKLVDNTFEAEEGEELCSSVIKIESKKGNLKFEVPARIAIPCFSSADEKYYDLVLNVLDENGIWNDCSGVEAKFREFQGLRFLETTIARLNPKLCVVIVSRLRKDDRRLCHIGGTLGSTVIENVSAFFPKMALNETRHLEIKVEPIAKSRVKQLETFNDACRSVRSVGPIIRISNLGGIKEFGRPVIVTLPDAPRAENIEDQTDRCLAELTDDGRWHVRKKRRMNVDDGKLTFEIRSPRFGFIVMRMDKPFSTEESESAAACLSKHARDYTLKMVLRQSFTDPSALVTNCVIGWKAENYVTELKSEGYQVGPPISGDFLAKDGQNFEIRFRGNIKNKKYNKEIIPFVYRRNMRGVAKREFEVEPKNVLAQHFKTTYHGFVQIWRQRTSEEVKADGDDVIENGADGDWQMVAEFLVSLPKTTRAASVKGASDDPLDEILFEQLCNSMEKSQRVKVIGKLDDSTEATETVAEDAGKCAQWMWDWYSRARTKRPSADLFKHLVSSLKQSGNSRLSTHLQQWGEIYALEREANIDEEDMFNAILKMASSAHIVIMNWKYVAARLEPRLQESDIATIEKDISQGQDRCMNAFTLWREKAGGEANCDTFIAFLRKMEYHATAVKLENALDQMKEKVRRGQEAV